MEVRMTDTEARAERNTRLAATDWTQAPDAPVTENERSRWRSYRQQLRDVPDQGGYPDAIVWPAQPEKDVEPEHNSPLGTIAE